MNATMKFATPLFVFCMFATSIAGNCQSLPPASTIIGEIHRDASGNLVAGPSESSGEQSNHIAPTNSSQPVGKATTQPYPDHGARFTHLPTKFKPIEGAITDVTVENTEASPQNSVPITFGQVFAKGDIFPTDSIVGKTSDGETLALQFNVKATHPDGSVRHAIISTLLPNLPMGSAQHFGIVKISGVGPATAPLSPADMLAKGFAANVKITLDGQGYSASVAPALAKGAYSTWLSGPIANEWIASVPLVSSAHGTVHPHLTVRFAIRSYAGQQAAKVDVIVENDWAYQPDPQNFTYDVAVTVGDATVYTKSTLTHYHHARWRKTFWWGRTPQINIRENTAYLIASKAVPNYDQTFTASSSLFDAAWTGSKTEPMGSGVALPAMPTTGGRPDIGLMPAWATVYLLSMDHGARDVTLGTADLAGSWSVHYRDQKTDRPVSLINYPYMTILGEPQATYNPATKKFESFPICTNCANPNLADSAHQPAFNYLPYLLTGDFYQLEELQFWAMWNSFKTNPDYRGQILGLVYREQVRDQAWSMRNIAEAAYITPDKDPLKRQLQGFVTNNLAWYNANYTNNPKANTLGINVDGGFPYNNNTGIAPWQDDFFTSSIGHIAELEFAGAKDLLVYKAKFSVSRMTDPGYCWIFGSAYSLIVRPSINSPFYASISQTYAPTLAATYPKIPEMSSLPCAGPALAGALRLSVGEMVGYSKSATGFPSNMQPALAFSVDSGAKGAAAAWKTFMDRSVKPDYATEPQFAILPR